MGLKVDYNTGGYKVLTVMYMDSVVLTVISERVEIENIELYNQWVSDGMPIERGYTRLYGSYYGLGVCDDGVFLWCDDVDILNLTKLTLDNAKL